MNHKAKVDKTPKKGNEKIKEYDIKKEEFHEPEKRRLHRGGNKTTVQGRVKKEKEQLKPELEKEVLEEQKQFASPEKSKKPSKVVNVERPKSNLTEATEKSSFPGYSFEKISSPQPAKTKDDMLGEPKEEVMRGALGGDKRVVHDIQRKKRRKRHVQGPRPNRQRQPVNADPLRRRRRNQGRVRDGRRTLQPKPGGEGGKRRMQMVPSERTGAEEIVYEKETYEETKEYRGAAKGHAKKKNEEGEDKDDEGKCTKCCGCCLLCSCCAVFCNCFDYLLSCCCGCFDCACCAGCAACKCLSCLLCCK